MAANLPGSVTIRWGARCAAGPLDIEDRERTDPSGLVVRERVRVLRIPTRQLAGIDRGALVDVTDEDDLTTTYKVREVSLADDGRVKDLVLVP